jgi:O-antigen ligase
LSATDSVKVKFYRPDFEFWVDVKRENLLAGSDALQRLGVERWNKSRNWRSSGFYGHYTTYAEVLQLIGSLIFGLLIASLPLRRKKTGPINALPSRKVQVLLFLAMAGTGVALLMTVTRASQLAFAMSAALIVLLGASRKWVLAAAGIGLPIALLGLLVLQQSRQVGFFDANDDSIKWRQTVWTEGYNLWTESPRNMMAGVGMDTIKRYAKDWHLFDDGRLPIGHFHSMPLQLLVERGIPALVLWMIILAIYARSLWRGLQHSYQDPSTDWRRIGILLGCSGGLLGIVASGMVHYNMGDQEVAMVFFLLMALGMLAADKNTLSGYAETVQ